MTPEQTAHLGKAVIDRIEALIDALPEGDRKATATHHIVRAHHHLTQIAKLAIAGGDITPNSVGGDKPPV